MRIMYKIALLISLVSSVISCEMKKELTGGLKPVDPSELPADPAVTGALDLKLNLQPESDTPESKAKAEVAATVDINDFNVQIMDSAGKVVQHFDSYGEYLNAEELLLDKGKYTIRASWGKLYEAAFDAPYFVGDTVCEIEPGTISSIKADCSLKNSKVNVEYNEDFLKIFKDDYSVVVTNGIGILSMGKDEQRVAYFRSGRNINLAINATTNKGLDVISKHKIVNAEPNTLYNISLGLDVSVDSIIDQLVKPGIKVDITMHTRDTIINIEAPALPPDPDDGTDEPGDESISIVGTGLDSPVEMTEDEALAGTVPVKVTIKAPSGLKNVVVKIIAPELEKILGEENPFDLINLTPTMTSILDGVGLVRPKEGDKEYTLDVTGFMKLMGGAGEYKFQVTVTDTSQSSLEKTLTVIINK